MSKRAKSVENFFIEEKVKHAARYNYLGKLIKPDDKKRV